MSLYNWSIKESKCSLCWAGSCIASQAWTHWLRELGKKIKKWENKKEQRHQNKKEIKFRLQEFTSREEGEITLCRCLVRWFPQEQTVRGNLLAQTTATKIHIYSLIRVWEFKIFKKSLPTKIMEDIVLENMRMTGMNSDLNIYNLNHI